MKPPNRVRLRNKFVNVIGRWPQLGAFAWRGATPLPRKTHFPRDPDFLWRVICGVTRDGRALMIYPILHHREKMPGAICRIMIEVQSRGGLVGTALNIGDVYVILADNPSEHKRPRRTFRHQDRWEELQKRNKNGSRADESE